MFRTRWMHNLFNLARSRQDRRRQAAWQRRRVRPMLEALEDRLTPSTVTESAATASELQTDLNSAFLANTQYIINLTGASAAYTLAAGQEYTVSADASGSSVSIIGTGQNIIGNGTRVFQVANGANLTLQDLTIFGGDVTTTESNAQGGGIFDAGGNVTLSNVTVQDNEVKAPSGFKAEGGGIFVSGGAKLTIQGGSVIQDNDALSGNNNQGGGVYASGASTVVISDSTLHNNEVAGVNSNPGSNASGGGVNVSGSGWTVKLTGDTFSGNKVFGGNGMAGNNATTNTPAQPGGNAQGGALFVNGTGSLTILNDLAAPTADPSTFLDNSAQGGNGGNGGDGTPAKHPNGGNGGNGGLAQGGALFIGSGSITTNIGNTTFYGNTLTGGSGGEGGTAATGGTPGPASPGGDADGGGVEVLSSGAFTMVNSTVANNTVTGGTGATQGLATGGGLADADTAAVTLDNNTITLNTLSGGTGSVGSGVAVASGNPTLVNNLIQGNTGGADLDASFGDTNITLSNANHNFITTISTNAVSTTSNIVGNSQTQLGAVVGLTGGPIYYPLASTTVASNNAGSTSVLSTISSVENNPATVTDEIGNPRSDSDGNIDLGTIQTPSPSPSPAPAPAPPTLNVPPLLAFINSILGGVETVNANGTETITDRFLGFTLFVSTFNSSGNLVSVDIFGFNITFFFV